MKKLLIFLIFSALPFKILAGVTFDSSTVVIGDIWSNAQSAGDPPGITPGTNTLQTYTYTFTATQSGSLQFYMRQDPDYWTITDASLTTSGGSNLLTNSNFASPTSYYSIPGVLSNGNVPVNLYIPTGWIAIGTQGLDAAGTLCNASIPYYTVSSCSNTAGFRDGSVNGFDGIAQRNVIVRGRSYTLTFNAKNEAWTNQQATTLEYDSSNFVTELIIAYGSLPGDITSSILTEDTQSSLTKLASSLKAPFTLQNVVINNALNYDCNVFDAKRLCMQVGAAYNRVTGDNVERGYGSLVLGYKANDHIRIGAFTDQSFTSHFGSNVSLNDGTPLFGAYAAWEQNPDLQGFQVRGSVGYGTHDLYATREIIGFSEGGNGSTKLKTFGTSLVASYNIPIKDRFTASPYFGLRYTSVKENGYTENQIDGLVSDPLTFSSLKQSSSTVVMGVKGVAQISEKAYLNMSFGLEQDINAHRGTLSASAAGIDGLTPIEFNDNLNRTRVAASAGTFYNIDKKQRISANVLWTETPLQSKNGTTAQFNYTIGF